MSKGEELLGLVDSRIELETYRDLHWTGSFAQYLDIVAENPSVVRNAFQRCYDMILSWGAESW